jgi:hypothetical protein
MICGEGSISERDCKVFLFDLVGVLSPRTSRVAFRAAEGQMLRFSKEFDLSLDCVLVGLATQKVAGKSHSFHVTPRCTDRLDRLLGFRREQ